MDRPLRSKYVEAREDWIHCIWYLVQQRNVLTCQPASFCFSLGSGDQNDEGITPIWTHSRICFLFRNRTATERLHLGLALCRDFHPLLFSRLDNIDTHLQVLGAEKGRILVRKRIQSNLWQQQTDDNPHCVYHRKHYFGHFYRAASVRRSYAAEVRHLYVVF